MNTPDKTGLQVPAACDIFDAYEALQKMAAGRGVAGHGYVAWLGGWFLAVFELDCAGIAALIAGTVGGAAVLAVDSQRDRVKELLRYGVCDFVVNDLDEALRIMKNEIRKKQPVSVCLTADPEVVAGEMVERGLQPEVLAGRQVAAAGKLADRGALRLRARHLDGVSVTWRIRNEAAPWAAGPVLARVDELAAEMLEDGGEETPSRRSWLQRAPRYMGRRLAAEHCVRMSDSEAERLVEAFRGDAALAAQVVLKRNGVAVET